MGNMLTLERYAQMARFYGCGKVGIENLVVDADLTAEEALDGTGLPLAARMVHDQILPFLVAVPVLYYGLDDNAVHFGQIVVHEKMKGRVESLFEAFFKQGFRIARVIPAAQFRYDLAALTEHNVTFGYVPVHTIEDSLPEHAKGWAIDINPVQNPVIINTRSQQRSDPPNAVYDRGPGVIVRDSVIREIISRRDLVWGGNWGDPFAEPSEEYLENGYYVYRHIEPNEDLRRQLKKYLPEDW